MDNAAAKSKPQRCAAKRSTGHQAIPVFNHAMAACTQHNLNTTCDTHAEITHAIVHDALKVEGMVKKEEELPDHVKQAEL